MISSLIVAAAVLSASGQIDARSPEASLVVGQRRTGDRIGLSFTLTNRSHVPLWVNQRMAIEEESCRQQRGEIRIKIVDKRGRIVPDGCLHRTLAAQDRDYGILKPGETASSQVGDLLECYQLDPGETVTVSAQYFDANAKRPLPPANVIPLTVRVDAAPKDVTIPKSQGEP